MQAVLPLAFLAGSLSLTACNPSPRTPVESPGDTAEHEPLPPISPTAWVARASIDLRGRRPTLSELDQATDMEAARAMVVQFADDDELGTRMAWLYDDQLLTAHYFLNTDDRDWSALDQDTTQAVGWAPLELMRYIVDEDLALTSLVTATELPRNDSVAHYFELEPPGTGTDWAMMPPPDARPMAGILSSSELWFVHDADGLNYNRHRANALARMFLCDDMLLRDVTFALDLSIDSLENLENAVATEPQCTTCHAALDPLAAFFGGFPDRSVEVSHPGLYRYSTWGETWTSGWTTPSWFGRPAKDLEEVGHLVAADPRFSRCIIRVFSEGLFASPLEQALGGKMASSTWLDAQTLAQGAPENLIGRELVRSLVVDPAYIQGKERVLRPESYPEVLGDLLGLDPQSSDLQAMAWSTEHRLLGGGLDDFTINERNPSPGVGHITLQGWAARANTRSALQNDSARPKTSQVLWTVTEPWATDDALVRKQLAVWHGRFLSELVDADSEEIDRLLGLWHAVGGAEDPEIAWATVVEALIRHPRFLLY